MKTKNLLTIILTVAIIVAAVLSPLCVWVYADESDTPVTSEQVEEQQPESNIESVADEFITYLIERYGADYEFYYNKIIENWGSVEAYLLSFGEKLPEESRSSWEMFVGWLTEYASVWAPALAVAIVIVVAVIGKKQFNKIIECIVNARLKPVENELNLQSKAMVSVMHSQKALLGTNERFAENVKELEESEKELKNG